MMTGKTHASCGLLIGMYVAKDYGVSIESVGIISVALLGSLIPDICHTKSTIGRKLPVISHLINFIFGHRTFTHSLLFMLIFLIAFKVIGVPGIYTGTMILGIASHIFLDFMTTTGVSIFYPIKERFSSPVSVKTGGIIDNFLMLFFLCCAYLIFR